jgi:hypothetical protein
MEIDKIRRIISIFGILFIIGASYLNLLGILEANTDNDRDAVLGYIVSANIINGLAIICLIILTFNSTKLSNITKIVVVLVLLAGLIGEYYLLGTQLYSKNYSNYIVLLLNLLLRVYYLLFYFNETWAMFPGVTYVKELDKVIPPQIQKMANVMDDDAEAFKERWRKLFRQARDKVGAENFDEKSMNKGWDEIINPAIAAKDYSLERLKEAANYLKDKSGNSITNLIFGGRKR